MGPAPLYRRIVAVGLALALSTAAAAAAVEPIRDTEYVGSKACAHCHTGLYVTWRKTRHSYSILSAEAARRAGYPLPPRRVGDRSPRNQGWEALQYTIGGRQRIAYATADGQVLDTSFHLRTGRWSPFPPKTMDCRPCHVTGPGLPARPGRADAAAEWAELNVGCEACHGPGARHARSQERRDIVRDASSRTCGECHTAAGRVLPQDDLHLGHDLVQAWNRDPHATSVRKHSHNQFCARCHAPFQAEFGDAEVAATRPLFSEGKQAITCIACHDPHDLTNSAYQRERVALRPPLPAKLHIYRGDDSDFTTPDYAELPHSAELCTQCHRGADRIDLDHAGATCGDCHNPFARNRRPDSRAFHDANHPGLSCRPCHRDADHLLSIIYRAPEFLQPEHVHNLRTLPAEAVAAFGFRYPGLRRVAATVGADVDRAEEPTAFGGRRSAGAGVEVRDAHSAAEPLALPTPASSEAADVTALRALLAGSRHAELAAAPEIASLQGTLLDRPQHTRAYFDLALAYAEYGDATAARAIVDHAAHRDAPWLVLELPLDTPQASLDSAERDARAIAETLLPPHTADDEVLRLWVEAHLLMMDGMFDAAAARLQRARSLDDDDAALRVPLALAELGRGRLEEAAEALEVARILQPEAQAAPIALAVVRLELGQFRRARVLLEDTLLAHPGQPVAAYVLGRAFLTQHRGPDAVPPLQRAAATAPELAEVWFGLGDAYRMTGAPALAAAAYGQAARRAPTSFEAQMALANALKWAGDSLHFQYASHKDAAQPPGTPATLWRRELTAVRAAADAYAERALMEYARALRLRPLDPDAIYQIGEVYRRSGRLDEARDVFAWLAQRQPQQWLAHYRLGAVLLQLGRQADATAALERARERAAERGDVYFALGLAYARAGNPQAAIAILQQGAVYEPFNPALYNNLGAALLAAGRLDEARVALERAIQLATFPLPRLHLTYTNLALVALRRGDVAAAQHALRNVLYHAPSYAPAAQLLAQIDAPEGAAATAVPVFNDLVEIFGELTTVTFDDE